MELRFPESDIRQWAEKYKECNPKQYKKEKEFTCQFKPEVEQRGYLDTDELYRVACWKAWQHTKRVKNNNDDCVKEITRQAFTATDEPSRIGVLKVLGGIGWARASAILHFFHKDPYPILDFRALWSVGMEGWSVGVEDTKPSHSFECWWKYVLFCRKVACQNQVGMRTLDRALWQYSKCNQPKSVQ